VRTRYYRALFSLPNGRLAVFNFTAAGDSMAHAHASRCLTMADDWPAGMRLRDVSFIGFVAPSRLGSLIVSDHAAGRVA
jgi:hypothetical protein